MSQFKYYDRVPSSKWPIEAELVAILGIEIEKFVTDRGA